MADSEKEDGANEDIVMPAGGFRDEEKKKASEKRAFDKLVAGVNNFHQAILERPDLWNRPELKETRDWVQKVSHDPAHFPPSLPTPRAAENVAAPPLTKGFALKVYAGTLCDNYDIENDDDIPIVVVTAVDAKHSAVELGQQSNNEKRFSLYVADGDDNIITVKIATQLNSRMASVQVGCVMKLFAFRRGFLPRVDDETPQHLALLVSNFQLCGTMEVKDPLQQKPTKRLPVDHPTIESDEESSIGSDDDEDSHYIDADDSSEEDDDNDDEPRSNWRNATCTNKRRLCHKFGYGFDVCVATSYRIEDFDLEEIAQDCWFVTKEVDAMTASEKRNVLYWWFMVNVYHIGGKGKRKCPPLCLIKAIRTAFPNPSGVPYVDFRRGRKRKR